MNLRFIDWIWRVRGSVALAPGQSSDDAFARLGPLFGQTGTDHQRTNDTLTFTKKDQAAQDKMSVFDGGVLRIEEDVAGLVMRYDLISRALLSCFLAPVLFVALAQLTTVIAKLDAPPHEVAEKPTPPAAMNPIDKALGAPAPDTSRKPDKSAGGQKGKTLSPTPAYVFAGVFAALYVVGRVLEDWLIRTRFKEALAGNLGEFEPPRGPV
ncbi:MAG: hypothetical protein WDO56_11595 [Gammaproteobacteria bacterium]